MKAPASAFFEKVGCAVDFADVPSERHRDWSALLIRLLSFKRSLRVGIEKNRVRSKLVL
jgi:hypothetical protein